MAVSIDAETVAAKLEQIVAATGRINGAYLGNLMRTDFPTISWMDFGCRTFRQFIERHAPRVKLESPTSDHYVLSAVAEQSRADDLPHRSTERDAVSSEGSPPAEGGASNPTPHLMGQRRLPPIIWFSFSSVKPKQGLYVNRETGEMRVGSQSPPGALWLPIPNVTGEEHVEIAKQFTNLHVPQDHRSRVDECVRLSGAWWKLHFAIMSELGLDVDWKRFHNEQILMLLANRLTALGVDPKRVFDRFQVQQETTGRPVPVRREGSSLDHSGEPPRSVVLLRELSARIVANMSSAELRGMAVRLGDVLDALQDMKFKT